MASVDSLGVVNDTKVLADGDVIEIAHRRFVFYHPDGALSGPTSASKTPNASTSLQNGDTASSAASVPGVAHSPPPGSSLSPGNATRGKERRKEILDDQDEIIPSKISIAGEVDRDSAPCCRMLVSSTSTFEVLAAGALSRLGLGASAAARDYSMVYRDDEGDLITMSSDEELSQALAQAKAQQYPLLELELVPRRARTGPASEGGGVTVHPGGHPPNVECYGAQGLAAGLGSERGATAAGGGVEAGARGGGGVEAGARGGGGAEAAGGRGRGAAASSPMQECGRGGEVSDLSATGGALRPPGGRKRRPERSGGAAQTILDALGEEGAPEELIERFEGALRRVAEAQREMEGVLDEARSFLVARENGGEPIVRG